jgi:hypothetical protein
LNAIAVAACVAICAGGNAGGGHMGAQAGGVAPAFNKCNKAVTQCVWGPKCTRAPCCSYSATTGDVATKQKP